jgi:hypothetical protein
VLAVFREREVVESDQHINPSPVPCTDAIRIAGEWEALPEESWQLIHTTFCPAKEIIKTISPEFKIAQMLVDHLAELQSLTWAPT